jgi:hypothetical protein
MPVTVSVFSHDETDVTSCASASVYKAPKEIDTARTVNMAMTSCFDFFMIVCIKILMIRVD